IRENSYWNQTGHQTSSIMKTLLTVCLCSLALALTSLAQSPAPPAPPQQPPPGPPPGAAAPAVSPGALANPAAPAQPPTANLPPGAPAAPAPPGTATSPAAPGATVTATLSPAPATPSPAAEEKTSGGVLGSNWLIDKFRKGGPIMWPILIVSIIGLTVVIERIFWWGGRWFRRDPKRIEKVFTAIE